MPTANPTPVDSAAALPARPWVAVVGNPFSGRGKNRQQVQRLAAALAPHGLEAHPVWDRGERRAMLCHRDLAAHCRAIVVAGGDGTVADVINELAGTGGAAAAIPLAVLPLGNENLLAKEFGFTAGPGPLAEAIAGGGSRTVDVGCARPIATDSAAADPSGEPVAARRFSLMLSVGLDAEVVHRLARWRAALPGSLRRVRHLSYVRPILGAIGAYPYHAVTLEADGRRVSGAHALVFNLPRYGMGLPFAPAAGCDDGLLDWVVLEKPGALTSLGYFLSVLRGKHLGRPDVHHGKAARLTITGPRPAPVQMDGDAAGTTPIEIEAIPAAIRVVAAG